VCAIASIVLLWKQRRTGASLGRRLTLPYTVVMFTASTVDFCLAMWTTGDSMISTVTGRVPQSLVACTTSNNVSTVFHMLPIFVSDALLVSSLVSLGQCRFLTVGCSSIVHM
jgi:predicted DNA repair protein MutK